MKDTCHDRDDAPNFGARRPQRSAPHAYPSCARVDLYQVTILRLYSLNLVVQRCQIYRMNLPSRSGLPLTWSKSRAVQVRAKVRATEHCGSTVQTGSRRDLVVISSWPVSSLDVWLSSPAHHYPCESEVPPASCSRSCSSRVAASSRGAAPPRRLGRETCFIRPGPSRMPASPDPACPPRFVPNSVDGSYVVTLVRSSELGATRRARGARTTR